MFDNPFSPIFGGKPDVFFGRDDILKQFDMAMFDRGSGDRALFFTGTRGSGKTTLLEQLSIRASAKRWTVVDLGPDDTIAQLMQTLAGFDETAVTASPQVSVSVLGTGGSLGVGAVTKTKRLGRERLQLLLLDTCKNLKDGLLVTVDEVQKVPIDDVSALCNSFQMASRKGHDVMLSVAGLPYSFEDVIRHEGCTYLRRGMHEELGLFSWDVAADALGSAFSLVRGLRVEDEVIDRLNLASYGHPYLIQLIGYYLVTIVNEHEPRSVHTVTDEEAESAISAAVMAYENRALKPLLDELSDVERRYLRAVSECLDDQRLASTRAIARLLGREQRSLSRVRANLIGNGIIAAPERGSLMFCIPYLADFVLKDEVENAAIAEARRRRL